MVVGGTGRMYVEFSDIAFGIAITATPHPRGVEGLSCMASVQRVLQFPMLMVRLQ